MYWEYAYLAGGVDAMNSDDSDQWNVASKLKSVTRKEFSAVGVAEEWTKIPGVKGAQQTKIAKMRMRKNWTECDKGRA